MLYDALLKSFNAQRFIVFNSWCDIGVMYANGNIGMLSPSGTYFDSFSSVKLKRIYFKTLDKPVPKHLMKCQYKYPHNDTLEYFSARCNIPFADIKKSLVKDVIWQMKHGEIYVVHNEPKGHIIVKGPSIEEFAISFDLALYADA